MAKGNAKAKQTGAKSPRENGAEPAKSARRAGKSDDFDRGTGIPRRWGEFLGVCLLAIGGLVLGGLFSTQFGDGTLMGQVGSMIAGALFAAFGLVAYIVAVGVLGLGARCLLGHRMELRPGEALGFVMAALSAAVLLHVSFPMHRMEAFGAGGVLGEILGEVSLGLFDSAGTYLAAMAGLGLGLLMSTAMSVSDAVEVSRRGGELVAGLVGVGLKQVWTGLREAGRPEPEDAEKEGGPMDETWDWLPEEEGDDGAWEETTQEEQLEAAPVKKPKKKAAKKRRTKAKKPKAAVEASVDEAAAAAEAPDIEISWPEGEGAQVDAGDDDGGDEEVPQPVAAKKKRTRRKTAKKQPEPEAAVEAEAPFEAPEIIVPEPLPEAEEVPTKARKKQAPPRLEELDETAFEPEPEAEPSARGATDEVGADAAAVIEFSDEGDAPVEPELAESVPVTPAPRAPLEVKIKETGGGAQAVQYLKGTYSCPPIELFQAVEAAKIEVDRDYVLEQAERIVSSLGHFKIRGKVTKVHPGPVITRYEFKPEAGVKLSRIENLENDLAMALEAMRIRILAPIPGKSTVGFEVPNKIRETVYVQENLSDSSFEDGGEAKLPLVLGKSITGKPVSIDLGKAPHLLVAGATGSGKSVGVNGMLCSLLFTRSPDDLRLILIDPKMLEFGIYDDIPHLLLPVITDADKASNALRWTVAEMERRYTTLSEARVRDIGGYNRKLPELQSKWDGEYKALQHEAETAGQIAREEGEDAIPGGDLAGVRVNADGSFEQSFGGLEIEARPEKLPYIVVVIDEFADLMMVAGKEVEANVARIAAKARAAGIHLIVATQRPSVDVITGTIKNNFPSRIAFQVTSDVDSRTVLDQKGAKQLLGMGDMLYMDRGKEPVRVHGCFVSEMEIERVVDFVKQQARPAYNMSITVDTDSGDEAEVEKKQQDVLYDKAVQIVAEAQKVSTSMIQRRLNIGYNRAAKIVEAMEDDGVIGPARGSQPREVFVSAA